MNKVGLKVNGKVLCIMKNVNYVICHNAPSLCHTYKRTETLLNFYMILHNVYSVSQWYNLIFSNFTSTTLRKTDQIWKVILMMTSMLILGMHFLLKFQYSSLWKIVTRCVTIHSSSKFCFNYGRSSLVTHG